MNKNGYKESSSALALSLLVHLLLVTTLFVWHTQDQFEWSPPSAQDPMVLVELASDESDNPQDNSAPELNGGMVAMADEQQSTQESSQKSEQEPVEKKQEQTVRHTESPPEEKQIQELIELANHTMSNASIDIPIQKEQEAKPQQPESSFKKAPSLAQLASGFMNHMAQHGPMNVKSDRSGPASMEQIAHVNYCQKIIGCLVNAYKCNKPSVANAHQDQRICIQLSLSKNGTIHSLKVIQPSGNHQADQYLVSLFKDASTSFPPVPDLIKKEPLYLPLFNIDSVHSFQTTNGWYIDSRMPQS